MRFRLKWGAALFWTLLSTAPSHSQINEEKKQCNAAETSAASNALNAARAGLPNIINAIKSNSIADQNRYLKWFGAGTPGNI